MNEFEKSHDRLARRTAESAEVGAENKEKAVEEAEKKMAARERVEVVSKEVKSTKQQIQNIVANMQQVVKAVAAIRAQLQLAQNDAEIPSVAQDQKTLEHLKVKLNGLFGEIKDLRTALFVEEQKHVQEEHEAWSQEEVIKEAEKRVGEALQKLGVGNGFES